MEGRAPPCRRFRQCLMIAIGDSNAFDASWDSRSTISHAALAPRTKRWCISGSRANAHHHRSSGNARKHWAEPRSMLAAHRFRQKSERPS